MVIVILSSNPIDEINNTKEIEVEISYSDGMIVNKDAWINMKILYI